MTKFFYCLLLLGFLSPFLLCAQEYTVENTPNPKNSGNAYVSDPQDYINPQEEVMLNRLLSALEDSSSAQIAVVTLYSIGDENPKDFATRLFDRWGIGQTGLDNGLLILTVIDQRRTEFETGYGLEGVLPDAYCYRIGMQELVPYFKEEQYGQGLLAVVNAFAKILQSPESLPEIQLEPLGKSAPSQRLQSPVWLYRIPVFFRWYIPVNLLFHLGLALWLFFVLQSKEDLYDRYIRVRRVTQFWLIILFPLPYLFVYFGLRAWANKLREQPRYSQSGKLMHKLSEEEDDRFLEKGQITEEEIGSVDYDVWVTEDEEEVLILKYQKRYSKYNSCPQCKFRTYYMAHSRTIVRATYSHSGTKEETYECKNCGYERVKHKTIPKKQRSSSSGGSFGSGGGGGSWGGGSSGGGGAGVSW